MYHYNNEQSLKDYEISIRLGLLANNYNWLYRLQIDPVINSCLHLFYNGSIEIDELIKLCIINQTAAKQDILNNIIKGLNGLKEWYYT